MPNRMYLDVTYSTGIIFTSFQKDAGSFKKTAKRRLTGDINEWSQTRPNVS